QIYMGSGAYGMEAAAQTYFGKSLSKIDLGEAALLAGLPKAPTRFSPLNNSDLSKKRMFHVLKRMVEEGYITMAEARKAVDTPIGLNPILGEKGEAAYFIEYIRQYLEHKYGRHVLYQGGLKVYTSLDLEMQRAAYQALRKGLRKVDRQSGSRNGEWRGVRPQEPRVEGALLAIDPRTGHIKAMVGGYDFSRSQFNRAVQAKRQPGSAFKPIIYLTAIASGLAPSDIVLDLPVVYDSGRPGEEWKPRNYTNEFYGPNTLRSALEHSRNVSTVRLLEKIGLPSVIEMARKVGISSFLYPNLSLALGASEVSLLELTSAYGVLANRGVRTEPMAIRVITDNSGKVLERWRPQFSQVIRPEVAYVATDMLKGVVERGTGRRARVLGRPAAAKTGTTNDAQDAWFIGYTPQLVAGVWVGYDQRRSLGSNATGGRVAAPIWVEFMQKVLAGKPSLDFLPPEGVIFREIDANTGLLAIPECKEVITEAFIQGTEPARYCSHDGEDKPRVELPAGREEF
ncbi:MAG: penicillin-binding protein 1A, partial [Dehalococcoidia bacterium]